MSSRPILVTVVGALNIALGALVVILAILSFVVGTMNINDMGLDAKAIADIEKALHDANMSWSAVWNVMGVLLLVPAIIDIIVGYGLLRGWKIMWWIGVILNALSVIGALMLLAAMAVSGMWGGLVANLIGLALNGVILWYMLRPNVKEFFGIS